MGAEVISSLCYISRHPVFQMLFFIFRIFYDWQHWSERAPDELCRIPTDAVTERWCDATGVRRSSHFPTLCPSSILTYLFHFARKRTFLGRVCFYASSEMWFAYHSLEVLTPVLFSLKSTSFLSDTSAGLYRVIS